MNLKDEILNMIPRSRRRGHADEPLKDFMDIFRKVSSYSYTEKELIMLRDEVIKRLEKKGIAV